jgi:hypothetical protein
MAETRWQRERQGWVKDLSDEELQRVVASVNASSYLDENEGDRTERREAIEWLLSRGERGDDWGIPAQPARELGLWAEQPTQGEPDG